MANAKISALPAASTPLAGTEVLPIVQSGVTDQVTVANLTYGRAVDTGNLTVTGTLGATGNFAIATNKFNVTASSGNTTVAGTLDSAGDFSVATNKFNVTASSGNTTVAGTLGVTGVTTLSSTLGVTGLTTLTGGLIGGVQSLSGAGAVNLTTLTTAFTSTGAAQALTLANGTAGQIKTIVHAVDGGSGVLTPTTALGYTTITFTNAGDTATLQYVSTGWAILAVRGATVA